MIINTTRYSPVPYQSGGTTAYIDANWHSLAINYPNVRRKKPKGKVALFTQGTWLTATSSEYEAGVTTTVSGSYVSQSRTDLYLPPTLLPGTQTTQQSIASNKIRSKAKGSTVNIALMMKEYSQTADLVTAGLGFLRQIADLRTKSGRRLRLVDTKIRLRDGGLSEGLSNRILAYNYGIVPTMLDLQAVPDVIERRLDKGPLVQLMSANQSDRAASVKVMGDGKSILSQQTTTRVKSVGMFTFNSNPMIQLSHSLRISNPLEFFYEAIPYSFVLDWFVNIGEVISSADNPLAMGFTFLERQDVKIEASAAGAFRLGGVSKRKDETKARGVPGLASTRATIEYSPSLSARRLLSGLALTRQRLPKSLFR